eukprot:TRINITY_DN2421_c0_g1_i1.p1 TRINITY_DN2421_c0_g1~~TRINITY_DN2421_c0_g1_i1.p1  ORF type:complete len:354 (+),score=83.25 TRINITY_DN2421_c0_g1_i1:52-1062(+)
MTNELPATPAMQAVAGAMGGAAANVITYPLITLSMLMQMHKKEEAKKQDVRNMLSPFKAQKSTESLGHDDSSEGSEEEAVVKAPVTTLSVLRDLMKDKQGWQRLYSGLGSSMYGMLIIQAVYYYLYSWLQGALGIKDQVKKTLLCASLAGAGGAILTNPIWVVSTRQIKTGSKKSTFEELRELVEDEGMMGLFKGLGPALILVSNPTIQFGAFEKAKQVWLKMSSKPLNTPLTSGELFILGALGKLAATICTYPYITAKTTLQSQSKTDADHQRQYESTLACLIGVYKLEGFRGLYRGLGSKVWQSVLTAALLFVLHDRCLSLVKGIVYSRVKKTA